MLFYFNRLMETWCLPPGNLLLLALVGSLLWRWQFKIGKALIILSLLSLWFLSTPIVAQQLIDHLQNQYPALSPNQLVSDPNAAIVVLEAGLNLQTPEYGNYTVSEQTLIRLRYAAYLHQKTAAAILVSGNDPTHVSIDQTEYMANALRDFFAVSTKWKENRGYNTAKEAILATEMLRNAGIKKIYLVTHALHMPRSVFVFQQKQMDIIPAPTGFISLDYSLKGIFAILPNPLAFNLSFAALHEYFGILWYKLCY